MVSSTCYLKTFTILNFYNLHPSPPIIHTSLGLLIIQSRLFDRHLTYLFTWVGFDDDLFIQFLYVIIVHGEQDILPLTIGGEATGDYLVGWQPTHVIRLLRDQSLDFQSSHICGLPLPTCVGSRSHIITNVTNDI